MPVETRLWDTKSGGWLSRWAGAVSTPPGGLYPSFGTLPALDPSALVASGDAVTWDSLKITGDSIAVSTNPDGGYFYAYGEGTFQSILNRCPSGKKVVFPPGIHEINEPGWPNGDGAAVQVPKTCAGTIGNAPPGTGWDDLKPTTIRTTFRVKENTAPLVNVAGGWFKWGYTGSLRADFANIHFEGTEQGMQTSDGGNIGQSGIATTNHRLFTNFFGWNQAQGCTARDCLSTGWSGANGAPPGETFGYEWYHSTGGVVARLYSDGRRASGGPIYGAVGFTLGDAVNCVAIDCYSHHNGFAGWVHYVTSGCQTYNVRLGDPTDHTTAHVTLNYTNGDWLNHELTNGNVHYAPTLNCYAVNKAAKESISHSGRAFSFTQDGLTCDTTNGTLEIVDPTVVTNLGNGSEVWISSWSPYDGQTSTYADGAPRPIVRKSDGTLVPFRWNYGPGWVDYN